MERWIETVHALPGRIRLRVVALRKQPVEAEAAARTVASLPGVAEIRVRPFTGSFLVTYDPSRIDGAEIAVALRVATGARAVLPPGAPPPAPTTIGPTPISKVGKALVQAFREANEDVLRHTGGGIDLGVLATAGFFAFGAAEVVATRKLAAPPWFNLAWWGLQTFISAEGTPAPPPPGAGPSGVDGAGEPSTPGD